MKLAKRLLIDASPIGRALLFLVLGILALTLAREASAHPLGNFTINRYSRLEIGVDQVRVRYVVDMAEISTFQERARMDGDGDGAVGAAEQDRYRDATVAALRQGLRLIINGERRELKALDSELSFPPGQSGLPTLRLSAWFVADLPAAAVWQARYRDDNYAGRLGWREIVVRPASSVDLLESTAPTRDLSDELRHYPDVLQSPPFVNSVALRFAPAGGAAQSDHAQAEATPVDAGGQSVQGRAADRFTQLITLPERGPVTVLFALLIAVVWGAAHALTPGHGKTLVAAYLVGTRATVKHALFLGATTTITHTAGVFLLGLITLFASRYVVPEQLYPWLEAVAGALVVGIGATLLRDRLRGWRRRPATAPVYTPVTRMGSLALAPIGGSRPAPVHVHPHDPARPHHHHAHHHPDHYRHAHDHPHVHDHGGHAHSHLPPGADGAPITWRELLALGVSGGLLPCPAALVVMLGAIALNRVGFGLVLIVAFSAGLAGTLTAIGIALVHAKTWLKRFGERNTWSGRVLQNGQILQALPALSALVILLLGFAMTLTALGQTGLLPS